MQNEKESIKGKINRCLIIVIMIITKNVYFKLRGYTNQKQIIFFAIENNAVFK